MDKLFEVHPKRPIAGVLPNNKRIAEPTKLHLNKAEFMRCMNNGSVYAIVGEDRVLVKETNYDKALELFDKHVEYTTKQIHLQDKATVKDTVQVKENLQKNNSLNVSVTKTVNNDKKETKSQPTPPVVECDVVDDIKGEKKENSVTTQPAKKVVVSKNK